MKLKRTLKGILKWSGIVLLVLLVISGLLLFVAYWRSTNNCEQITQLSREPMKAILKCDYGGPEVLRLADIDKPTPDENQLLVKVHAASLNALDGHLMRGPFFLRLLGGGLRKPTDTRLGVDYAGVVQATGKNVTQFKSGDEVFGGKTGAFAQYICVRGDKAVALKPANMTFEQAAAVPVAALTALQGLRDKAHVHEGQKVLINGASGGVGTFAVEIAKALGAEVTGVCSTRNVDMVRSIGADRVIDYTKEDFTTGSEKYDVIFDLVANHSFSDRRRVLTQNGICVLAGIGGSGENGGQWSHLAGNVAAALFCKFTPQKFVMYISEFNQPDINVLRDLMQSGKLTPVIDRTYKSLGEIPEALGYLEQGHARGKVVIAIE